MAQKRFNLSLPFPPGKILGGGFLVVGLGLMLLLVLVLPVWTRLDCDRSVNQQVSCRLRGANLIGVAWRNQKVMPMVGAETNLQSNKGGYRYRTSIFTYNDEISLAPFSVDYRQASQTKKKILDFVEDKAAQKLEARYPVPWILFVTAIALAAILSSVGALCFWLS